MRKVLYKNYNEKEFNKEGLFHQWGEVSINDDFSETVAIVELPDGTVTTVLPEHIKFVSPENFSDPICPKFDWEGKPFGIKEQK